MDPVAAAVLSSWTFDAGTLLLVFAIGSLYLRGWLRLREERPYKYATGRLCSFAGGLVAIVLALESPVDAFGSLLLQAHMIQHLLLLAVAPPLLLQGQPVLPLLRGLPRWIFKDALGPFLSSRGLKRIGGVIVHPVVAWCAMSVAMVVWHVPRLYDLALRSPGWHEFEHACFFWSAVLFWWPVVGVWPARSAWPRWAMIPYLLFAGMVNMGVSAVLSFSNQPLYASYVSAPRVWGISAHEDQAAAGGIMWVLGSLAMLIPAVVIGMQELETHGARRVAAPQSLLRVLPSPRKQRRDLLGALLRVRHFRRGLQAAMLALAIVVVAHGFTGPQVAPLNLAGFLPWTWWRGLAVIALLVAGNLFCMACPFTLPRDLSRRFLTPRFAWPMWLRSKWLAVGLLALYLWAVEAFSLWDSPLATAWIIAGYFTAAFAVDTLFKGASFCKYVCPIGQFHFVQSLVSPTQIKVREPEICESCKTYDCIRGNARSRGCELQLFQPRKVGNFDCTFCLDCVQACPSRNVGIQRVSPVQSLLETQRASGIGRLNRRLDVAALILILVFGGFLNAAGMTGPVMMWMHGWHARPGLASMVPLVTALSIAGLVVVPAVLAIACAWLSRLTAKTSWKELLCGFSLALVPIGFSMWLAHFSRHLVAAWSTVFPAGWILPLQLCFLDAGLLLTLYAAWRIAGRSLATAAPWAVLAISLYAAAVWIVFQPMQMPGMTM
jgi:cytochrome c oxidase assembly factor CtaG/polyferredoxin